MMGAGGLAFCNNAHDLNVLAHLTYLLLGPRAVVLGVEPVLGRHERHKGRVGRVAVGAPGAEEGQPCFVCGNFKLNELSH